jgi:hypothetical protein
LGAVTFEGFLLYSLIDKEPNWAQALMTIAATGLLYAIARLFIKIGHRAFMHRSVLPVDRSYRFASERCNISGNAEHTRQDLYRTRRQLLTNTLRFAEERLQGWLPGSHFELCVFVDQEQPLLFSYFDSNHDETARSMTEREQNPFFYVEKHYEVTKLLHKPTSQPRVLRDTYDTKTGYVFTSKEQRKQLRSSVLVCLDLVRPCALVISSDAKNAFSEADPEVMAFVKFIGELVRYDLFEGGFVYQIRGLQPQLFHAPPAPGISHSEETAMLGSVTARPPLSLPEKR